MTIIMVLSKKIIIIMVLVLVFELLKEESGIPV